MNYGEPFTLLFTASSRSLSLREMKKNGRFSKEIFLPKIRSHPLGNLVPLTPFPSDIPYATLCSLSILIRTKFLLKNPAPNDPTFSRPMLHLNEIPKEGPTERTTGRWTGVGPRFLPPTRRFQCLAKLFEKSLLTYEQTKNVSAPARALQSC